MNAIIGEAISSNIEGVGGQHLHGWVCYPSAPEKKVVVDVIVDGTFIGTATANLERPDLAKAKYIPPDCAFTIQIPATFLDGKLHVATLIDQATKRGITSKFVDFPDEGADDIASAGAAQAWGDIYLLFDTAYYLTQAGNVSDPLQHYQTVGWREGLNPHPLFHTNTYLQSIAREIDNDPLTDFFDLPAGSIPDVHPLFEAAPYLKSRPDVGKAGIHPLVHYMTRGSKEGVKAGAFFDEAYYCEQCPGLKDAGFIPLVHYLAYGWREGKKPHREFSPKLYSRLNNLPAREEPYTHFVKSVRWPTSLHAGAKKRPRVSIIILNLQKWLTTLQCIYFLALHTKLDDVEIIILDNGSSSDKFSSLPYYCVADKIIRLPSNHGFGEGNNIAAEQASGEYLLFLNNDVFVTHNWLPPLLEAIQSKPDIGAVGPMFIYPDGSLQEAGAMMSPDGTALQRGKHLDPHNAMFCIAQKVDYCSAATLLMRTSDFINVYGFDLCWDPAYYEDADLCLKLRLIGKSTYYMPESKVYHVENGTSSDSTIDLRLHNVVAANRLKFVGRWGSFLSSGDDSLVRKLIVPPAEPAVSGKKKKRLALYTPYPLYPGGGERYLLTIASETRDWCDTTLVTPEPVSQVRLLTMGRELGLELGHVTTCTWNSLARQEGFDFLISMGNEVIPPVPPIAPISIFHCQFPFPMHAGCVSDHWGNLQGYDSVIVNSEFTREHYLKSANALQLNVPEVVVVSPPVPNIGFFEKPKRRTETILNVGRFAPGGHCKRQDTMIEVFRKLLSYTDVPMELQLVGALGQSFSDREYLLSLQTAARGLPVRFRVNVSPEEMSEIYRDATIYWHCTGIDNDVELFPERFEHFGITVVEAMSAGVVPIVLGKAGPKEIVKHGKTGFLIESAPQLEATTYAVAKLPVAKRSKISLAAASRAATYSTKVFRAHLERLLPVGAPEKRSAVGLR